MPSDPTAYLKSLDDTSPGRTAALSPGWSEGTTVPHWNPGTPHTTRQTLEEGDGTFISRPQVSLIKLGSPCFHNTLPKAPLQASESACDTLCLRGGSSLSFIRSNTTGHPQ